MYRLSRFTASLVAIALAVVCTAACGNTTAADDAVVEVGEMAITKAAVDHWTRVEGVLTYQVIPRRPVPRGVVPDPPDYTACTAYLEARVRASGTSERRPKLARSQLRSQCQQKYQALQRKMLEFLITYEWLKGELADLGVKVRDGEVTREFERFKHREFHSAGDFENYLKYSGMSVADVLLLMKDTVLSDRLLQRATPTKSGLTAQQRQHAVSRFNREVTRKWTAKTSCHAGYVVPECKQYKGAGARL